MKKLLLSAAVVMAFPVLSNTGHGMLLAAPETKRQTAFSNLLTASGEKCPSVTKTFYQGSDKKENAFWNVQCSNGKAFVVQLFNDSKGSTKILDCAILKAINAGTCFTKFK